MLLSCAVVLGKIPHFGRFTLLGCSMHSVSTMQQRLMQSAPAQAAAIPSCAIPLMTNKTCQGQAHTSAAPPHPHLAHRAAVDSHHVVAPWSRSTATLYLSSSTCIVISSRICCSCKTPLPCLPAVPQPSTLWPVVLPPCCCLSALATWV